MDVIRQMTRDALASVLAVPDDMNRAPRQPGSQKSDHFTGKLWTGAVFARWGLPDGFAFSTWATRLAFLLFAAIETHQNRQRPDLLRGKRKPKLQREYDPVMPEGENRPAAR